jgi:ferrous-iron efflux pump FieF
MAKKIPEEKSFTPHYALYAGTASIVTVAILIVIKTIAYTAEPSASILAALIDSCSDAGASLMSLMAIHISLKPADRYHRYGHGKIEGLAALLQGLLIAGGAVFLIVDTVGHFSHPVIVEQHNLAMVIMAASIILSVVLVLIQKASLVRAPSLAVESDKEHYGADIIVNIAVLAALILQSQGAPNWIDPSVAFCIALWLMRTAWQVTAGGLDMLLDREVDDAERTKILDNIRACQDVLGVHDLRTRMVGMNLNISFDIEVDPNLSLRNAHAIAKNVELCLMQKFPNAEVMIHVDPDDDTEDSRHNEVGVRSE